jgi:hypothetical protein
MIERNEINLIKNNKDKKLSDVEWLQEFYEFLQGNVPNSLHLKKGHIPKMSPKKAFKVIYYLQEHFPVFPDHIEKCWSCGRLFDTYSEGLYWESKGRHYCGSCDHLVPLNYDRGRK